MKNESRPIIRCGTPDCDWGFPMPNFDELAFEVCYSSFRKHSAEVHGMNQDNASDCLMHLDLEKWMLMLLK